MGLQILNYTINTLSPQPEPPCNHYHPKVIDEIWGIPILKRDLVVSGYLFTVTATGWLGVHLKMKNKAILFIVLETIVLYLIAHYKTKIKPKS